jgi:hypothetical protein
MQRHDKQERTINRAKASASLLLSLLKERRELSMSELPKFRYENKTWYVDLRLMELRNVDNPHDKIELNESEAETIMESLENAN